MNIDAEFQGYLEAAYGKNEVRPGTTKYVELRRAFLAGVHWAACQCRETPAIAPQIVERTLGFANNVINRN